MQAGISRVVPRPGPGGRMLRGESTSEEGHPGRRGQRPPGPPEKRSRVSSSTRVPPAVPVSPAIAAPGLRLRLAPAPMAEALPAPRS